MRLGTASTIFGPRRTAACPGAACLRRGLGLGEGLGDLQKMGETMGFSMEKNEKTGGIFELCFFFDFEKGIEWNLFFLDSWDNAIFHQQQFLHHFI